MPALKQTFTLFLAISSCASMKAQYTDTATNNKPAQSSGSVEWNSSAVKKHNGYKSFLVPGVLMVYGVASLNNHTLKQFNGKIKEEMWQDHPHATTKIDDYLRFTPAIAVYGLNAMGIKGKNNFRDRTMIYLLSNVIVTGTTFGAKKLSHELRPDGSDYYSFPSGHTAAAFAAAEFMRQEYKDVSPWYGIAGYAAAGATGALRIYNNKHWVSDVLAGAGVGIASTKLAYLIYPAIKRKFFKDKPVSTMIMPYYQDKSAGLALVYHFR
ncbi:MAG: phosphatase PAP2 family protein [Ferruginibacter sp.]